MQRLAIALFILPLMGQEKLSQSQCEEWTRHTLKIAREDPEHPLHAALRLELSTEAIQAQVSYCLQDISPDQARCQLAATNFAGLMACRAAPPPAKKEEAKTANENFYSEIKPATGIAVNAESCDSGYNHLLKVFRSAPALLALRTHQEILRNWESTAARNAFRNRCLKRFKEHDLGCIMGSEDAELIQVCLLNVPED
ncbi:MAG: hypothetical protein HS115_04665 [Spirochaetales bacterium]|nr:hypothetical protein [Spirochaetales bacterium]